MRQRHPNFLPRGSLEARHLPRGLHHWFATYVARNVVYVPVCWAHGRAVQQTAELIEMPF